MLFRAEPGERVQGVTRKVEPLSVRIQLALLDPSLSCSRAALQGWRGLDGPASRLVNRPQIRGWRRSWLGLAREEPARPDAGNEHENCYCGERASNYHGASPCLDRLAALYTC